MSLTTGTPPSYRQLLEVQSFPRLVGSLLFARAASTMVGLVLVLFALERFQSPALAGAVTFLSLAPGLLLSRSPALFSTAMAARVSSSSTTSSPRRACRSSSCSGRAAFSRRRSCW